VEIAALWEVVKCGVANPMLGRWKQHSRNPNVDTLFWAEEAGRGSTKIWGLARHRSSMRTMDFKLNQQRHISALHVHLEA
jgi:hypothetical protein